MPVDEYLNWQRFDQTEPLGLSAALDVWFARLMVMLARVNGNKSYHLDHALLYTPTKRMREQRIADSFGAMKRDTK